MNKLSVEEARKEFKKIRNKFKFINDWRLFSLNCNYLKHILDTFIILAEFYLLHDEGIKYSKEINIK